MEHVHQHVIETACSDCGDVIKNPHNPETQYCPHISFDGYPGCDSCLIEVTNNRNICYGCYTVKCINESD